MGVDGGLGAAGILLLVLSFIGLGVGFYYAYMCIQSKPRKKRSHDPEHGPLISADPDVNGNHEDSLVASAPLPYIPKSKIDEPDSSDEKAPLHTKEENDLGVEKSESVLVPIEAETKAEEAVPPTVEETSEAAVPVVVIPPESMPEHKDIPKVDCPGTKSAESAPTLENGLPSAENGAAPRDCDLPVPIIMNAAFAVAKPITDSDEEDGLLLQKRLHHDDSLDPEPVPPLVPIAHSIVEAKTTSMPKEEPSTEDVDEPIPSAPPKESTADAAPDTVLPTAPPKAITPELPISNDENAQPSAPPEELTIESSITNETKDNHIIDDVQPEDGVVYLETYKPTASEPLDSTLDDNIKEENSSTESSPEELAPTSDPVAEVENKPEVTETEPVAELDPETSEHQETVVIDPSLIGKNSYGWSEGVVPTDPSSYGWSNDVAKVETELVKSSIEPIDCNIGKCKPVLTEEKPSSIENKDFIIDNEPKVKDEFIILPPVVEESVVPLSHDEQQLEPESSEKSVDISNASISSEEAVPPYTESAEAVKIVIPTNSPNYGWSNNVEKVETDEIIIPPAVEEESAVPLSHKNSVSTENVLSPLEPEMSEKSVDILNDSLSSEEAVPPYTVSAETVESTTEESLDQIVSAPEAVPVITVPKDETGPIGEDDVDKVASPKDTEPEIEASETEPLAHVLSKVEASSDKEVSAESILKTEDIQEEVSLEDRGVEESMQQVEDAPKVTSTSQETETEIKPEEGSVPINTLSSELKDVSTLESQVEEPIARNEIASLESLPEKIEVENTDDISSVDDTQTALTEQQHTDHSDTESSEPDITEYSFSTGPTDATTAKVLEDELSSSLEPEVTKYRTLPIADDTATADNPVVSSVASAVTITECDTDSASSISLSSDDEADDNSEGNKADSDSDISLSSDEEKTSKVDLDKEKSNEVKTAEATDTPKEIAKEEKNEESDETESDGAENPKEMKEEVVEVVQVVQEVEEKDEENNEEEEKETVKHHVHQDSDSDDSELDDNDDKSTASSSSEDSDADKVPCVKKSKIPRLKSKQSNV